MEVNLDLEWNGIVGQGRRSKVKVKHQNPLLTSQCRSHLNFFKVKVKGRCQGHGSRSNVWCVAVNTRGLACRAQQNGITLTFGTKNDNYQSEKCVCVIMGLMHLISRTQSIGF